MTDTKITTILEGELDCPKSTEDLLDQAGRLLDKSYAHEIIGDAIFVDEDGVWKVASVEVVLEEASPAYLKDRLQIALEDLDEDSEAYRLADAKLRELEYA